MSDPDRAQLEERPEDKPPVGGDGAATEGAVRPQPENTGERMVPEAARGEIVEAEHLARYLWASQLADGRGCLDAGCGLGYGTAMLARAGATFATGVDIDPDAVAVANDRYGDVAGFAVADLHALPEWPRFFDLVTCFEAIEHIADPERGLDELTRVLRDNGILIVSSPHRGVYPTCNVFHVHEFTPDELESALRKRFQNVRMYGQVMHLGSLISNEAGMRAEDPEQEVAASVRKLVPAPEGEELYTIAVASDGALPELDNMATLTGPLSPRIWYDATLAWEERARRAEAEAAVARIERAEAVLAQEMALKELGALKRKRRFRRRRP